MDCSSCGYPNREGARFCAECATPLLDAATCPSCGAAHPQAAKFCDHCGHALAALAPSIPDHLAEKIRSSRGDLEGERKQVTVLFADVMGSMELAERTDPDQWRAIMERFFAILCDGVHRFEGTVDKFTGDGIMALFGAPIAHEDHARRACYAALGLQGQLSAYAAELRRAQGLNFSVRIGLNSGEVAVGAIGDDLGMAYTAVGHTVGLAQRMEQLAEPGKTYLSDHTAKLVDGYLVLADLGEFNVKGVSRPLHVHELTGVGAARGRLDVSRVRGFSRFVGRTEELHGLEATLEQALAGEGQVIGIVGEAGVGKSRLCHEFTQRLVDRGTPVYHLAGQAHATSVPLLPVLEFLRAYFEIGERDSDQTARERIAGKLLLLDSSFEDDLPLLFDFLAVPDPDRPPPRMDPEARQRRVLGVMKRLTHARSARQPGVFVFEDLHWLDAVSETFLANHVEAVQATRSLVVVNFRPEYHAAWMSRSYYRQIALAPLGPEAVERLLEELLGSHPSLDGLAERIRERTRGNPFFIEELVQALDDAGSLEGERGDYRLAATLEQIAVPAGVQAVLAARIDRLSPREKAVLQAAAVIGKEFSAAVLQLVVALEAEDLEEALRGLAAGEFVYEQELYPEALYAFKHPLTQEVALGSLLAGRRAAVHAAVARAIAERSPERLDERAALLAEHWEAAGELLEAARWHARAGTWSGYSDPAQALVHWRRIRELTDALPESDETAALGFSARISSLRFGSRTGISHEESEAVFAEAERMANARGDVRSRVLVLLAYGSVIGLGEGDVRRWATLIRRGLALVEESGDRTLYVAIAPSVFSMTCAGEYREALAFCDRALAVADGDVTVGAGIAVPCPYAFSTGLRGFVLTFLGRLAEARRAIDQGRTVAREQGDVEFVGFSHLYSGWLGYFQGEPEATLAHARQSLEIAERTGSSFSRSYGWFMLGVAERMRGAWQPAIEALERSQAIARERHTAGDADGARLAMLGESHLGLGDPLRARALAEEAVESASAHGHAYNEILARLALARILLGSAGPAAHPEIEVALARALDMARDTGAQAFEPLVHVQLGELTRQRGDNEGRERELREALRLFTKIGATGHAGRLSAELAAGAAP